MKTQELRVRIIYLMITLIVTVVIPTKTQSRSLLQTNCSGSSCYSGDPGPCQWCIDIGGTCSYTDTSFSCRMSDNGRCPCASIGTDLDLSWYGILIDVIILPPLGVTLIARYILCPLLLVVFLIYKCRQKRKSQEDTVELVPRQ